MNEWMDEWVNDASITEDRKGRGSKSCEDRAGGTPEQFSGEEHKLKLDYIIKAQILKLVKKGKKCY